METDLAKYSVTKGTSVNKLEELGFKRAASQLKELKEKSRKLALAYEHYRFVTQTNVDKFNAKLMSNTGKNLNKPMSMEYQFLAFTPIGEYEGVPPNEVLAELETAIGRKCFDAFEIGYIKNVKDPLLFGRVHGTPNRFFIAQWDNDVKIDDLLTANEG